MGSSTWTEAASRRTERPGRNHDAREDDEADVGTITDRQVGSQCSRIVEERPGIRPLLQPGKARNQQRCRAEHFPETQDDQEVARVAEVLNDRPDIWYAHDVPHSSYR